MNETPEAGKINTNAPAKTMTMELASLAEQVFIATSGGVVRGNRLAASGRCPGRGCGHSMTSVAVELLHKLARSERGPIVKLGESACPACGQRVELWPRRIAVVK